MSAKENPFTPSFGEIPAHLAGRQTIINGITRALESDRRKPELTTVFSGARGTGKTTLLSLLANRSEGLGWIAVNTTAIPGMLDDIELELKHKAAHLLRSTQKTTVQSLGIPDVVSIGFGEGEPPESNWRSRMSALLDQLESSGTGLLITVDEIDPELPEMIELAAVYQHFIREERKVALLMAGLPHSISSLLNNKTVSFLRRAQLAKLGRVADYEVELALKKTIRDGGRTADEQGVAEAVKAIGGFPFLIQLIGYRSWDINPTAQNISLDDFKTGITIAHQEMNERILEATYRELSPEDVRFATAMLQDEGVSKISDLVTRLERSSAQVAQYRKRLIEAGVIGERGRGLVAFELPYFREYLAEQQGIEL